MEPKCLIVDFDNINQKMKNLEFEINKMKINFQNNFPIMNNNFIMMNQEKLDLNNDLNPKNIEGIIYNILFEDDHTKEIFTIHMNGKSTIGEALKKYVREHTNLSEDTARQKLKFIYSTELLQFDSKEKIEKIFGIDLCPKIIINTNTTIGG